MEKKERTEKEEWRGLSRRAEAWRRRKKREYSSLQNSCIVVHNSRPPPISAQTMTTVLQTDIEGKAEMDGQRE
jgi:hypothetical protein